MESQSVWPEFNSDRDAYFLSKRFAELGGTYSISGPSDLDEDQGLDLLLGLHLNLQDFCRSSGDDTIGLLTRIKSARVGELMVTLITGKRSSRFPALKDLRMSVWAKIVSETSALNNSYGLAGMKIKTDIEDLIGMSFPVRSLFGELMLYRWSGDVLLTKSGKNELLSYIEGTTDFSTHYNNSILPPGQ
jgi:hypothetical protein